MSVRERWFRFLGRTLNPVALRAAHRGRGPFSAIRHVGRKTGRVYETPIIVAPTEGGFVAELTYGPEVAWYRNLRAAGSGVLIHRGREIAVDGVRPLDREAGLAAYGPPRSWILRALRRRDFLLLHARDTPEAPSSEDENSRD
ncbi:nitroreductase family deazaflavin-dependent oxidoreductase [Protaetiibacter mangrovi]|uniref:Nitroreductase family deazaflavin-dependent oxidoreductase n=1 Tax=Protaetiibacter mangrovi TaxID=2970926 RepID=A0ABT1ZBN4_9MICO|nr:nitroreductase family deazaflavin-dependent oxidoreductase [Protaetiibacter mangrovi]MCS0498112.1 nitroreductase family deazaflavin-dependent oxidoreductase [Protaetiibacter mangrovi]TPX00621.1 nitroreductase family deazaflavin-dependent oxidoreductase [Schumannella luteola]